MRKNAGLIVMTLLLLIVPALANAWTLTVKVAGGTDTNNVTVTYGTVTKVLKSASTTIYPTSAITYSVVTTSPAAVVKWDGGAVPTPLPASGSHILSVTYPTTVAAAGIAITQADGGMIYAQNLNKTWSSTGVSGLANPTTVQMSAAPDAVHKVASVTVDGVPQTLPALAAGEVFSFTATATNAVPVVTATYAWATALSGEINAPATVVGGQALKLNVSATTNDGLPTFNLLVDGTPFATNTTGVFSVPTTAGHADYVISATVTTANNSTGITLGPVTVGVVAEAASANTACNSCHLQQPAMAQHSLTTGAVTVNACTTCHSATPHSAGASCIGCHSIGLKAEGTYVNDNNGVRAITGEFSKWSHHVTGTTLQDAHCVACHLEGKVVTVLNADGSVRTKEVKVDATVHMTTATTHLRNADTDADMVWDPATPNHSTMDNFCMSCHDANGATSPMSVEIQSVVIPAAGKTASPSNPFGDTISNRYDKMQRPAVVNVSGQFDVTNNSHHAVKGARYTGRTRAAGVRQIASPGTFANNSSAVLYGKRSTIYDAGNFNALYVPLGTSGDMASLGDDSTLHCGDCHTVGQWKAGVATNAAGQLNTVAIGAHGSNNEYMLRNTAGTDARHTQNTYTINTTTGVVTNTNNTDSALLVCFNCHAFNKYGSAFLQTGAYGSHAGEYAKQGRCNGSGNTISFAGYTTGAATDGTQFLSRLEGLGVKAVDEFGAEFTNAFGMQCANCHNSGVANAYGGIHGSKNNQNSTAATVDPTVTGGAYIDGKGNTTKFQRFLPGLGNVMYVPGALGGITGGTTTTVNGKTFVTGGITNDTNWEQKVGSQVASGQTSVGAGCYTLRRPTDLPTTVIAADRTNGQGPSVTGAGGAATDILDTWGACDDHNAQPGGGTSMYKRIVRPVTY